MTRCHRLLRYNMKSSPLPMAPVTAGELHLVFLTSVKFSQRQVYLTEIRCTENMCGVDYAGPFEVLRSRGHLDENFDRLYRCLHLHEHKSHLPRACWRPYN